MSRAEAVPARHHFLLVEDDPAIRSLLITILGKRKNTTVDCAIDGEQAIALLRAKPYSAVLLDLMLPNVNGFEVLRAMRSIAPEMLMRTIVITAASESTLRDFDHTTVFALLRKPFEPTDLLGQVEAAVGTRDH